MIHLFYRSLPSQVQLFILVKTVLVLVTKRRVILASVMIIIVLPSLERDM